MGSVKVYLLFCVYLVVVGIRKSHVEKIIIVVSSLVVIKFICKHISCCSNKKCESTAGRSNTLY